MATAPQGALAYGGKRSTSEDEKRHSTKQVTDSLNILDAPFKNSSKIGERNEQRGAASHQCPCCQAADSKVAEQQQQRNAVKQEKAPFFHARKKRKRQRLDPCAAILARHMYADDAAESCVIPEGVVSVYEAPLESEPTESSTITLRALPPKINGASKKTEEAEGEGETCKKRKRLEEATGAFGEGDDDLLG
ncbi:hypothetical protein Esti_004112 [Eimeria stiedai]